METFKHKGAWEEDGSIRTFRKRLNSYRGSIQVIDRKSPGYMRNVEYASAQRTWITPGGYVIGVLTLTRTPTPGTSKWVRSLRVRKDFLEAKPTNSGARAYLKSTRRYPEASEIAKKIEEVLTLRVAWDTKTTDTTRVAYRDRMFRCIRFKVNYKPDQLIAMLSEQGLPADIVISNHPQPGKEDWSLIRVPHRGDAGHSFKKQKVLTI